ncbi:LacI family DNA-binding transcriptional regulator [Vallitalea okinawensis]|uniref:LacI family DNA-binding transcriptional regulator n=1 Tax=Vallitalea okinawensis TaxID=2078660 RepID=UPI000CFCAA6F|nr:LacI family DNA-binding transcriptional regulator [Vallitalea okinawensis]
MRKVTIRDVAKEANVAPSTVSRVISDDSRISDETKEKVRKIMKEMNYYPNSIARSLANNKTETIGIIMPSYTEDLFINPFFQDCFKGISSVTSKYSYDILIAANHRNETEVDALRRLIQGNRVDGLILMRNIKNDPAIEYLIDSKCPFVIIGTSHNKSDLIPMVDNNNLQAAYDLTRLLMEKGNRRIAFIGGDADSIVSQMRIDGYKKALQDSNLPFNDDYLITGDFLEQSAYELTEELLTLPNRPEAIIVMDDLMSLGVVKKVKEFKLKIPRDIMIASFNNSILSRSSNPAITSIDINSTTLGKKACNKLFKIINKDEYDTKEIVPYKIIERESTNR